MKKQLWDLTLILLFFCLIFIKDYFNIQYSKTNIIKVNYSKNLQYQIRDYNRLKKINDLNVRGKAKCILSIKSHPISDFYNYLSLFNNDKCNVLKGDYIVNTNGLVGIVYTHDKYQVKVKLVTNSDFKISIRINNAYGTLLNDSGQLVITDLTNDAKIKINDLVYTSGLTGNPDNIIVGKIANIKQDKGLNKIIYVTPTYNDYQNPYVIVIGNKL